MIWREKERLGLPCMVADFLAPLFGVSMGCKMILGVGFYSLTCLDFISSMWHRF
jgi:hypothetical protein